MDVHTVYVQFVLYCVWNQCLPDLQSVGGARNVVECMFCWSYW